MSIPNDTCQKPKPKPYSKSKVLVSYLLLKTNRHFLSNISLFQFPVSCYIYIAHTLKVNQLNIYSFKEKP